MDDVSTWAKAAKEAAADAHKAKSLKSSALKNIKMRKKAAKAQLKLRAAKQVVQGHQNHLKHHSLRNTAAKATGKAVRKAMAKMLGGVSHLATKAAALAASSVIASDKKRRHSAEKAERIATVTEGKLQKKIDDISRYRKEIRSIQLKEMRDNGKAKAKAFAYAQRVKNHVKRAKIHFLKMKELLAEYRAARARSLKDIAAIKRMLETIKKLKKALKQDAHKLHKEIHRGHKQKRQARREFKKLRKVKRKDSRHYLKIIKDLRAEIRAERLRKNTPDKNGQARLNQLNIESQGLAIKIGGLEAEIRRLKRRLTKSRKKVVVAKAIADKRKKVLKVAHKAYKNLEKALRRLKKLAMLNRGGQKVLKEPGTGLAFAKSLVKAVRRSVKKSAKKARKDGVKHLAKK